MRHFILDYSTILKIQTRRVRLCHRFRRIPPERATNCASRQLRPPALRYLVRISDDSSSACVCSSLLPATAEAATTLAQARSACETVVVVVGRNGSYESGRAAAKARAHAQALWDCAHAHALGGDRPQHRRPPPAAAPTTATTAFHESRKLASPACTFTVSAAPTTRVRTGACVCLCVCVY